MRSRRPTFYILNDDHEPVGLTGPDPVQQWARWLEGAIGISNLEERRGDRRRVDFTDLGFCTVSTVFLGIDHNFFGEGPPILFETMIFANLAEGETFPEEWPEMRRYATWAEAEAGHAEMVAGVRERFWKRRANGK